MLAPIIIAICASSLAGAVNIRHLELNGAHLIDLGPSSSSYTLTSPELDTKGWAAVNVHGDEVMVITSSCDHIFMSDKKQFEGIRASLNSVDPMVLKPTDRHASQAYPLDDSSILPGRSRNIDFRVVKNDDATVQIRDSAIFSVSSPSKLPNFSRVFIIDGVVAFVDKHGSVTMKPSSCLSREESELVYMAKGL